MFTSLIKQLKSIRGNSLAEFAVTTAMMATLATTAAPKFGAVGSGAKEKKTMNNIDKLLSVANNYYNAAVSEEGKGRFPGQSKYDSPVGGIDLADGQDTDEALEAYVEDVLANIDVYTADNSDFVYVFSPAVDDEDALQGDWMSFAGDQHQVQVGFDADGAESIYAFQLLSKPRKLTCIQTHRSSGMPAAACTVIPLEIWRRVQMIQPNHFHGRCGCPQ